MFYFLIFLIALISTALLTLLVKRIAVYFKIIDQPDSPGALGDSAVAEVNGQAALASDGQAVAGVGGKFVALMDDENVAKPSRKIHKQATPLLGGVAIFIVYFILLFLFSDRFLAGDLRFNHLLGFALGALFLIIGGVLDDKYDLKPSRQIIFPLLAIGAVILGGVEVAKISNPAGGVIDLRPLVFVSPLLIFFWLLGMMYTTKLLDGVDGLVSGIGAIGGLVIFLFTLTTRYYQPDIAFAALLFSAACLGFLIFNWHPAKIFLGEGGSLLVGYVLGVLAIISGGKIAIALLIMGLPVLDVAWTIFRRLLKGKNPFRTADCAHLHHRLLAAGLSPQKTVLIFYFFALAFGLSGLFLQSRGKFWALVILGVLMLLLVIFFSFRKLSGHQPRLPRLLLHICCAPCGSYISRERLQSRFDLTWYFYNSNLNSPEEYEKRLLYVKKMAAEFKIPLIIEPYNHPVWQAKIKGRENDPECGPRCLICYRDRLAKTARLAREKKFDFFSTTLLVSPYKDGEAIRKISRVLAAESGVAFLDEDFQADDGYRRSHEFAKEKGFYRQKFCGCEYSLRK